MASGTCTVCGCTEDHACPGGCSWADPAKTFCTQCAYWVKLLPEHRLASIFDYCLVPVTSRYPISGRYQKKPVGAFRIHVRRLTADQLQLLAYHYAETNDATVEEVLESIAGEDPIWLDAKLVLQMFSSPVVIGAPSADRAQRAFEEAERGERPAYLAAVPI